MGALDGAKGEAKVAGNANQRQIPVIQTQDGHVTQLQQNANKVLRNLSNNIVELQTDINQFTIIGEVKIASLSVEQFQSIAGSNWLLCNGQSCVDSDYSRLTGNNVVPTISLGGLNNFIRID